MQTLDQPAQLYCEDCTDNYCEVCFAAQHRKGTRKQHKQKDLEAKQLKPKPEKAVVNGNTGDEEVRRYRGV